MLSSLTIKERALDLGFELAGIASIAAWKDLEFSRQWVAKGFHGEMRYLENPKRFDPRLVLPSAKSVICVGLVYNAPLSQESEARVSGARCQVSGGERAVEAQGNDDSKNFPPKIPPAPSLQPEARVSGARCQVSDGEHALEREMKEGDSPAKPALAPSPQPLAPFVFDGQRTTDNGQPASRAWISRYAWGQDYHEIMRAKLERLRAALEELAPGVETRVFVDTGPVVERAFARFSGIGWMGKNTCIINQEKGSWFFLGVILTNLELAPDLPAPDRCGSCTACLEACPTGALSEPYIMDASRCISYFTIEMKGPIPERFRPKIGANLFGCDICQDVCPWNNGLQSSVVSRQLSVEGPQPPAVNYQQGPPRQEESRDERRAKGAATTKLPQFNPMIVPTHPTLEHGGVPKQLTTDHGQRTTDNGQRTTDNGRQATSFSLFNPRLDQLALIGEDDFRRIFATSPFKRAKYRGWLRNLCVVMGNSGDERFVPWLEQAAQHPDPIVREHAVWALARPRWK